MKTFVKFAALAALLAALILGSCDNPFDLVQTLTVDVKSANNLFLVISSVTPEDNLTNVRPDVDILVQFDRAVDMDTVTAETILITLKSSDVNVGTGMVFSFNPDNNTLTTSHDFLEINTDYSIHITAAVKGTDGSELAAEKRWSFSTGEFPAGNLKIDNDNSYANSGDVTLAITVNRLVDKMRFASSEAEFTDALSWELLALTKSWTLPSGDGEKAVYAQFYYTGGDAYSSIVNDKITLDVTPPIVDAGSIPGILGAGNPSQAPGATASDATSGIDTYSWQKTSGPGNVGFDPSASDSNPSISADADGDYVVTLTVTDKAGNQASDTLSFTRNTTLSPNKPNVSGTSPSTTRTPTWSWSSGGGPAGIPSGIFHYKLNIEDWSAETSATSYTSGTLLYGPNTLYVQEKGTNGLWSASGNRTTVVTPTTIAPYWGAENVSTRPTISWPTYKGTFTSYLFWYAEYTKVLPTWISIDTGTAHTYTFTSSLSSGKRYDWYYQVLNSRNTVFDSTDSYPGTYTHPYYYFTTIGK
jgi:hypothetical protein